MLLAGAGSVQDASAVGDSRTLTFHHTHSKEDLTVTFKRNGRYDEEGLRQINHFLRDWRSQDKTTMNRQLFDILWEVYRDVDAKQPINIISAYRSPATNAMLRRRSSGVARSSQHMLGHAIDFFIPGVPLEQIRFAGLRQQRGGVGFYPTSGSPFVHLDTGNVRHWPRMNYDQLARVFPNGRTVHVPSNGTPLPGYELALADLEKRGGDASASASSKPSLLTSLFKGGASDDDEEAAAPIGRSPIAAVMAAVLPDRATGSKAAKPDDSGSITAAVPMPRAKPATAAAFQVASADIQQNPVPRPPAPVPAPKTEAKPQTPADIINARGFWDDMPKTPKQATPAQVAAISARQALAAATSEPQATGSLPAAFEALAYAPVASPVERAPVVAASAPIPRSLRPASAARNPMAVTNVTTVIAKDSRGHSVIATSTRLAAAPLKENDVWLRAMIIAPSASHSMAATVLGDADLTMLRTHYAKPQSAVTMTFSDDPQLGLMCEQFTGSALVTLVTTPFARTASLR